jgi:hypothetical protein
MVVRKVSKAWYRHFDTSLTHIHITVLAWNRHLDTSLTHIHTTALARYIHFNTSLTDIHIEVSVPSQDSDVYVC